jgi:two-component system, cell cycle sensor histidine kinase and response regulator CckA
MGPTTRILLIDDNPSDCVLAQRELQREFPGLELDQVSDRQAFEDALQAGAGDLAIVECQLHWTDALVAVCALKERCPRCPVVMFTRLGSQEIAVAALKAGCDDYLVKSPGGFARLPFVARAALVQARQRTLAGETEARYRSLFDGMPIGLYRTTPAGQILDANPALAQMLGYLDRDALLAMNVAELYASVEEREQNTAVVEQDGILHGMVVRLRRQDGTLFWAEDHARAVRGPDGAVEYYEGSLEDVTERKRAQEILWQTHLVVEHSPVVVYRVQADGLISFVSGNVHQFGYEPEELIGKRAFFAMVHPEDRQRVYGELDAAAENGLSSVQQEHRLLTKDGQVRWLERHTVLVRDAAGRLVERQGIVVDITDRKRMEAQFLQAQKMEMIGRLAGGVAHDFNNLLTSMIGYATFVREALPPQSPAGDDIGELISQAQRAARLTHQLLAFSRLQTIAPRVLCLNDLVMDISKMLQRLIGEDIELVTCLAADLRLAKVDPGQMEQVLVNLVVNARDAMPEGGRLTIETSNETSTADLVGEQSYVASNECVRLTVRDTGTGMSDEVKGHLFEPFFTTKEPGKGTGLGLATVFGIVRQHQGSILVDSELDRGSAFHIYLPRADGRAEGLVPRDDAGHSAQGRGRVLVVEDEAAVRGLVSRMLASLGYSVVVAVDGNEALHLALEPEAHFDVLVTDVIMPRMNGVELARRLRIAFPDLPVVYVSGYSDRTLAQPSRKEKGIAFLAKPFNVAALAHKLREVLEA